MWGGSPSGFERGSRCCGTGTGLDEPPAAGETSAAGRVVSAVHSAALLPGLRHCSEADGRHRGTRRLSAASRHFDGFSSRLVT